jgi:hypothetical protein
MKKIIVQLGFYVGFGSADRFGVRHKNSPDADAFGVTTLNNTCAGSVGREISVKLRERERERERES